MKNFSVIGAGGPRAGGWMAWMLIVLFFMGVIACTKTKSSTVNNPNTPLQTLVNTDTSLTLFHHLLLRGNDVALLADDSATILIPTNNALRQAGYPESIIDSASSAVADRLLRYQYLPSGLAADSGTLTANPTLLGSPIYAERLGGVIVFNTTSYTASGTPRQVGKAKVYFLNSTLTPPVDSLPELLFQDTSLSFLPRLSTGPISTIRPSCRAERAIHCWPRTITPSAMQDMIVLARSTRPVTARWSSYWPISS
ncbi:hypothetical protein ACQ86N_44825 [Puia sp. P3]|uniref:hypothetical protein n=1 Tax=Puia sp. P3 TaxID=3423952 RepID=UPI003D667CC1